MTRVRKILRVVYRNTSKAILPKIQMYKQLFALEFIFKKIIRIYNFSKFFLNIRCNTCDSSLSFSLLFSLIKYLLMIQMNNYFMNKLIKELLLIYR